MDLTLHEGDVYEQLLIRVRLQVKAIVFPVSLQQTRDQVVRC